MKYAALILLAAMVLTGCQPAAKRPEPVICPGKASTEEAVRTLRLQEASRHPIRASVEAVLTWTDEKGKPGSERIDNAQLRYVPPDRLFLRGDKFGEIRFGTNPESFWLMIKPELDSFWWGSREAGQKCTAALQFDPWHVAEALGTVEVDTSWTLSKEPGYDVLTLAEDGAARRRIWVQACSYLIERIEIYPADNEIVRILPGDYRLTESGYAVASSIRVEHYRNTDAAGVMKLELSGIGSFEPTETQMRRLFERPSAANYKNVYRLTEDCEFVRVEP